MPDPAPEVSVIIVSYNTRELLRGCLESLRRVSDEALIEIIVVDNASGDGSPEMVADSYPDVSLLRSDSNHGFASAVNLGRAQASGEFLFILNPDTLVPRGSTACLMSFLTGDPTRAVAGARITDVYGRDFPSEFSIPTLFREFWNFLPELKSLLLNNPLARSLRRTASTDRGPRVVPAVSGAAFMVRRSAFDQIGGMDGQFFLYHEELDLCTRLANHGFSIWTVPAAQVIHFDAQASGYTPRRLAASPVLNWRVLGMDRLWMKHRTPAQRARWNRLARKLLHFRIILLSLSKPLGNRPSRAHFNRRISDLQGLINELKARIGKRP